MHSVHGDKIINILFTSGSAFIPTSGGVERVTTILTKGFISNGFHCEYLTFHSKDNRYLENTAEYPCPAWFLEDEVTSEKAKSDYHAFLDEHKIDLIFNQDGLFEYGHFFLDIGDRRIKRLSVVHSDPNYAYDHVWHSLATPNDDSFLEYVKCLVRPFLYFRFKRMAKDNISHQIRFLYDNNDKVVFLAPCFIEKASRHFSPIRAKSMAIANPNTYAVREMIPEKDSNECLFVGRFDNKSKNLKTLLDIWEIVRKMVPDAHLSMVGWGESEDMLKDYAIRKNLRNITFYPRQTPDRFYEKASFFCMTSVYEGFPMGLTESMCHGCIPIVFDSVSSVHDILGGRESGCIIKAFRKKEYANAILDLMNDEARRKSLYTNALDNAKRFQASIIIQQWVDLIHTLTSR